MAVCGTIKRLGKAGRPAEEAFGTEFLHVPGAKRLGRLPDRLVRLRAEVVKAAKREAVLERQLERAKRFRKSLEDQFEVGVEEVFPLKVETRYSPTNLGFGVDCGRFFDPNGDVWEAPADDVLGAARCRASNGASAFDDGDGDFFAEALADLFRRSTGLG